MSTSGFTIHVVIQNKLIIKLASTLLYKVEWWFHAEIKICKMVEKKESRSRLSKNTSKDRDAPSSKKVRKKVDDCKPSGGVRRLVLLAGLSTVVVLVAVIYINTDIPPVIDDLFQKYIGKVDFFNEKANLDKNSETVPFDTDSNIEKARTENIPNKNTKNDKIDPNSLKRNSKRIIEPELSLKEEYDPDVRAQTNSEETESSRLTENNVEEKGQQESEVYAKRSITSTADLKIRKKLDAADDLLETNDLEAAAKKYDSILKKYPNSPRAMYGKAQVVDKLADKQRSNALLEESIALADKALHLPDIPDDLLLQVADRLAKRQQFRGWMSKALNTCIYVAEKFPENIELQNKLGVGYIMAQQDNEAKDVFRQILEKKSNDGFALCHLGFLYKTLDNDPERAIPLLKEGILTKHPGTVDGRFYMQLGDALQRVGETDEAYVFYKEGAELGLFLSPYQRSLYNSDVDSHPWWTLEQTGYYKYFKMLEENWQTIRDEGLAQMDPTTGSFLPEEENLRETGDWKQFTLYQRGKKIEKSCAKTPQTCALIDKFTDAKSCKRGQIKFSVMHPGVHVWPHCGPTNCRIRAHLGLVVPDGPRIRVVNDTRMWTEGKFIVFDDSFEHEVWHDGTELRLVLIVDVWHPDISLRERSQLTPI